MKKIVFALLISLLSFSVFAKSGNSTQVIQSGHWVYDDLYTICAETRQTQFLENQPLTVGELKFYLRQIPYENLSFQGKVLYDKVKAFLTKSDDFFPEQELRFYINPRANPEFYYKSNPDIDWSFNYNYKNFLLTVPIIIGFSDYITIEPDVFIGKNYIASKDPYNFTNIPYGGGQFEFMTPRFAYGSTGITFDNWGVNFHVGKEQMQIGTAQLGSIIYNKTFETDAYFQLNVFSKWLKYTMNVVQVCNSKFFYTHELDFRVFRNLRLAVIEGSLLNSSFELRYLNPFMFMHQFGSWIDYGDKLTDAEKTIYTEGHFCAYLAFALEYVPVNNVRIYAMYSQNEILDLGGDRSDAALSVPDSLGGQLGVEVNIPLDFGYIKAYTEAVYTSPYLYIKQSPNWSLIRERNDMLTGQKVYSWMGLPYGPDCFAVKAGTNLYTSEKWSCGISYLFKMHGENYPSIFKNKIHVKNIGTEEEPEYITTDDEDDEEIYGYYPSVEYHTADNDDECIEAKNKGRYMWITGTPEISNQIAINGSYNFLTNLQVYGQLAYTFVYNTSNQPGKISHGVEIALGMEYRLLK